MDRWRHSNMLPFCGWNSLCRKKWLLLLSNKQTSNPQNVVGIYAILERIVNILPWIWNQNVSWDFLIGFGTAVWHFSWFKQNHIRKLPLSSGPPRVNLGTYHGSTKQSLVCWYELATAIRLKCKVAYPDAGSNVNKWAASYRRHTGPETQWANTWIIINQSANQSLIGPAQWRSAQTPPP